MFNRTERWMMRVADVWVVIAALLGVATVLGLCLALLAATDWGFVFSATLFQQGLPPVLRTAVLYTAATALQISVGLLVVSHIGSPGAMTGLLLVLPFSVGVAAPATIARAFLQPELSDNLIAEFLSPLESSFGVAAVVVLFDTWQWLGLLIIALGLQLKAAAPNYKDAAAVEGFSRWQTVRWLVAPACRYVVVVYALIKLLDWLKKEDLIRALVGELGGHDNRTLPLLLSRWYFSGNEVQTPASAVGIGLQLSALLLLVSLVLRLGPVRRVLGTSTAQDR